MSMTFPLLDHANKKHDHLVSLIQKVFIQNLFVLPLATTGQLILLLERERFACYIPASLGDTSHKLYNHFGSSVRVHKHAIINLHAHTQNGNISKHIRDKHKRCVVCDLSAKSLPVMTSEKKKSNN